MMSLIFGLFTQVSGSGPLGPLVSTCFVCVWGGGGGEGEGVRFSTAASAKKITSSPPINNWLVPVTKSPKGHLSGC